MTALTKDSIQEMIDMLQEQQVKQQQLSLNPLWPLGVPVIESPHVQDLEPIIKLSEHVNVSPEFRNKCNQHYIDVYGYREPMMFRTQYGIIMGKNMADIISTGCTA